jgi:AcrR family transcriptional regulator
MGEGDDQDPPAREPASSGRAAQRRRTRAAIVAATRQLVADGKTPSIDEIAAAADVSRRTIYMYFPTVDQLLLDATVALLSEATIDAALDPDRFGDDVTARIGALVQTLVELAPDTLPLGRKIIRLTVDAPPAAEGERRGYRRVEWIERAVEPLRERVTAAQYERLVSALSLILGWEAMVVLRDVRGLDATREAEVIRWASTALVEATLQEISD